MLKQAREYFILPSSTLTHTQILTFYVIKDTVYHFTINIIRKQSIVIFVAVDHIYTEVHKQVNIKL